MSIDTWIEEFYPVPASVNMSTKEAIEHSLKKFEGFQEVNLLRHKIVLKQNSLYDEGYDLRDCSFKIDVGSCALCKKFHDIYGCHNCPLVRAGFQHCDTPNKKVNSAYQELSRNKNPYPMIEQLKKVLELEKGEL